MRLLTDLLQRPTRTMRNKIILLVTLCTFLASTTIGTISYLNTVQNTTEAAIQGLADETRLMALKFKNAYDEMRNDTFVAANTPPIKGLIRSKRNADIDQDDNSSTDQWRARLATYFTSIMNARPHYTQMRYIGIDDKGREIVRVNRAGSGLSTVIDNELQQKSEEPYMQVLPSLEPGRVYFSEVTYNREKGSVTSERVPTVRATIPIHDEQNKLYGAIVINANYPELLRRTFGEIKPKKETFITNNQGDFLEYLPGTGVLDFEFSDSYTYTPPAFIQQIKTVETNEKLFQQEDYFSYFSRLNITPKNPDAFIGVVLRVKNDTLLKDAYKTRYQTLLLVVFLVTITSLLAMYLAQKLTAPLQQMSKSLALSRTDHDALYLPLDRTDEVGPLARAFDEVLKDIAEGEEFLKLILDNNPDLVFVKDQDYRILKANAPLFSVYPEDMHDKIIGYTTAEEFQSEEAEAFLKHDKKAFENGYSETYETLTFPDGKVRTLFTKKIRFEDSHGTPFILGVAQDVTEREKLIERLQSSNEELERFAFICSHDLQEPLRMIRSFSTKLQEHMGESFKKDERGKKYFHFITDAAERAQALISDILEYSSINSDSQASEIVDIETLVDSIKENMNATLEEHSGTITYDALPSVQGNKTQCLQLLQNLIGNGLKYQSPNTKPNIHISAKTKGNMIEFAVRDNGIGMEAKYADKIFEIFQRLHRKSEFSGTGIGLAICRKVVQRHGGEIWVQSAEGEGSTFYFTLPAAQTEQ